MRLIIIFILINTVFTLNGFSQDNLKIKIDSLKTVLSSSTDNESYMDAARDLAKEFYKISPDSTFKILDDAIVKLSSGQDSSLLMLIKYSKVFYHFKNRNFALSKEKAIPILKYYELHDDGIAIAKLCNRLGICYLRLNKPDTAVLFIRRSQRIYKQFNDEIGYAKALNSLGAIHIEIRDTVASEKYFTEALPIFLKYNKFKSATSVYNNLGIVYKTQKEYKKSAYNYEQSIKIDSTYRRFSKAASTMNNFGIMYDEIDQNRKSITLHKSALNYLKIQPDTNEIIKSYILLVKMYTKIDSMGIARNYIDKTNHYINSYTKNIPDIAIAEFNRTLSGYYIKKEDFAKAVEHYKSYHQQLIKIENDKDSKFIQELEAQYSVKDAVQKAENLEKENEIQFLQIQRTKFQIIGIILGALIGILLITLFFFRQRWRGQKQKAELETQLFRSQMNPHFIFNSLTAIQAFVYAHQPREAAKYLSSFAKLTRAILTSSRKEYIPMSEEITTLNHYLDLQKIRFENRFTYELIIDKDIEEDLIDIPPLLTQPFIENAIEHGFQDNMDSPGLLEVKFELKNKYISVSIIDNGIGLKKSAEINKTKRKDHKSLATIIVKDRLKLLLGKSKISEIEILDRSDINPEQQGTLIRFNMPFKA